MFGPVFLYPIWPQCPNWLHLFLVFFGKIEEEIMLQGLGNAPQQGNVDTVLAEYLVHVRPRATDVFGQPCGRYSLPLHYFLDMLPDMHRKSVEFISCLSSRVSTPHTPNKLFHAVETTAFPTHSWCVCPLRERVENFELKNLLQTLIF